jgi:hypothetical protein
VFWNLSFSLRLKDQDAYLCKTTGQISVFFKYVINVYFFIGDQEVKNSETCGSKANCAVCTKIVWHAISAAKDSLVPD